MVEAVAAHKSPIVSAGLVPLRPDDTDSSVGDAVQSDAIEVSLCGDGSGAVSVDEFLAGRVTFEHWSVHPELLYQPNLVVRCFVCQVCCV